MAISTSDTPTQLLNSAVVIKERMKQQTNGHTDNVSSNIVPLLENTSVISSKSNLSSETILNNCDNKPAVNGSLEHATKVNGYVEDDIDDEETKSETKNDCEIKEITEKTDECDKANENNKDQDVVFIQDIGFNVKISSPGVESFSIQVSSVELVQEIHQLLMDREDTCHRTCFSLQLDNVTLDNFAELKNIEGLKEGCVIKVVEEPYTVREARIHVRHVRDLLKALDPADAYNGVECNSLSFLNIITQGDIIGEKKKNRPDSVDCTPPDYIMPGVKELPISPLHPITNDCKGPQTLKVLTTSGWNPPPAPRKMKGDLLYLYVITLEDKRFHITACTRGFYVNHSSEEEFNPRAVNSKQICHSLIDLLSQISPSFKRNFTMLQRKRTQKHPFERFATPYQLYSWMAPQLEHNIDAIRAEDAFSSKLGYEEHIPGQTRDWNEELQTTRELPRKTLPERLLRERAIFKVHSDFVAAANRGAMAVIDGNVMAINPGEEAKMQMFIWNNIFFSLGFDVRDHYKQLGGDAAAFIAPKNDLQGVKVYNVVDQEGLYTLGTVVIDYRGYRVTAQSIIPGILEREQEQSVVYGSVDFGKTIVTHDKYLELLKKAGQQLKILPHKIINENDEEIELCSSVECKGIIGNDGRHYILDLLRTFPPDVNFLKVDELLSDEMIAMGFPIEHKHKLCCLRQELIDAFVESRYMTFIRCVAYQLQQLNVKKCLVEQEKEQITEKETIVGEEDKSVIKNESKNNDKVEASTEKNKITSQIENIEMKLDEKNEVIIEKINEEVEVNESKNGIMKTEEAKKMVESINNDGNEKNQLEDSTKEIIAKAAEAVSSLKSNEFYIRFNPDAYSPGLKHPHSQGPTLKKERKLVIEAAEFIVTVQIPGLGFRHEILPIRMVAGIVVTLAREVCVNAWFYKGTYITWLMKKRKV
ncbi:Clustered mitochondria [Nymphon striatum]|nr:Clustered mitochondria [Nymphon striatum]